jgi:hypothetical protein
MPTGDKKSNGKSTERQHSLPTTPDDFPAELLGEFREMGRVLTGNLGTIAGLACAGGGYFGFSVTDDGESCRLAVRHGQFTLDKRFSSIAKLEGALAYCLGKLQG